MLVWAGVADCNGMQKEKGDLKRLLPHLQASYCQKNHYHAVTDAITKFCTQSVTKK